MYDSVPRSLDEGGTCFFFFYVRSDKGNMWNGVFLWKSTFYHKISLFFERQWTPVKLSRYGYEILLINIVPHLMTSHWTSFLPVESLFLFAPSPRLGSSPLRPLRQERPSILLFPEDSFHRFLYWLYICGWLCFADWFWRFD